MPSRPKTPPKPDPTRVLWKTAVVDHRDADAFARALEAALHELTDDGYAVVSQFQRGSAYVLIGRKSATSVAAALPAAAPVSRNKNLVFYYYQKKGVVLSTQYAGMSSALRDLRLRIKKDDELPIRLIEIGAESYEPTDLPGLLRLYSALIDEKEPVS